MSYKHFKADKLIRDNLPRILQDKGVLVHEKTLTQEEFIEKLKEKLEEETEEVQSASSRNDLLEELADIQEVVQALAKASGIDFKEIEEKRLEKRALKGGFDHKIYCDFFKIEENNPAIQDYLKKPQKYLETLNEGLKSDCLFCQMAERKKEVEFIEVFPHCFAIKDQFPVSLGHVLIIPKEHTENWFTAQEKVRLDMVQALHILKNRLDLEYHPEGYNFGANCGAIAGQTIMHLHLHLIPRYHGDVEDPKGGVRGVIPSKQKY